MADAGNMRIVIVAMHVTADTHDQQCHLLIAVKSLRSARYLIASGLTVLA